MVAMAIKKKKKGNMDFKSRSSMSSNDTTSIHQMDTWGTGH